MKRLFLILALAAPLFAQTTIRWRATTGDVSLSGSAYSATVQQPSASRHSAAARHISTRCRYTAPWRVQSPRR